MFVRFRSWPGRSQLAHLLRSADRVLYTPERLALIAAEAAKENSLFSKADRVGLLSDAMALSKAGFAKVSSALTLMDLWKDETECVYSLLFSRSGDSNDTL